MKKIAAFLTLFIFVLSLSSHAQRRKRKKNKDNTPTAAQMTAFKMQYGKVLKDSIHITDRQKRDTVASLQVEFLLKKMKISQNKDFTKEDKEVRYGMLENDKYMHLGALLSVDELERLQAFEYRQKLKDKEREAQRQEQYNQQSEQRRNYNRRRQRGYGGYGGYGGGYGY